MRYVEITVHTTTEGSELIADVMWRYTDCGVAISDVADVIALQRDRAMYWDYMDESLTEGAQGDVLVKAFVPEEDAGEVLPMIRADIGEIERNCDGCMPLGSLETTCRDVEGDDWIGIWERHFRPIHIGECVVVVPEWIGYDGEPGEVVVRIDSNMAFGTGEHETTSMCLEFLEEYVRPGDVCMDVGCGSGILGIAAVKMGAGRAYLTDIDDNAVASARHNAVTNGVADAVTAERSDLFAESVSADIVTANITADILMDLAEDICGKLREGGVLILSGIVGDRLAAVTERFASLGLAPEKQKEKGEWYSLAFRS